MDGFDLGIGILFPWIAKEDARSAAINSIAPAWDGNETWLVLGGGGLLAAFPLAYAVIMPAVYVPIIAMLLGLVFGGVALEFRARTGRLWLWDVAFAFGLTLASFAQGVTLGAILQGIVVTGRSYGGGWWDWLTPFNLLTGNAVVIGYGLLGACWLIYRTEGPLQERCFRLAPWLGAATLGAVVAVSAATPFLSYHYYTSWLHAPGLYLTGRGKALENGTEGDTVNVLNLQSKRTVQGIVIGPGQVSVSIAAPRIVTAAVTADAGNQSPTTAASDTQKAE